MTTDQSTSETTAADDWSAVSVAWESSGDFIDQVKAPATEALVDVARIQRGDHVLELGAGGGTLAERWADLVGETGRVVMAGATRRAVASVARPIRRLVTGVRRQLGRAWRAYHGFETRVRTAVGRRLRKGFDAAATATRRAARVSLRVTRRATAVVRRTAARGRDQLVRAGEELARPIAAAGRKVRATSRRATGAVRSGARRTRARVATATASARGQVRAQWTRTRQSGQNARLATRRVITDARSSARAALSSLRRRKPSAQPLDERSAASDQRS